MASGTCSKIYSVNLWTHGMTDSIDVWSAKYVTGHANTSDPAANGSGCNIAILKQ